MNTFNQDRLLVGALCSLGIAAGWLTGEFGWSLFIALAIWAALQQREKRLLLEWSRHSLSRPQSRLDSWQWLSTSLYRTLQKSRTRNRNVINRLRGLRRITNALPDAALILNEAGDIEDLNKAALALLNLQNSDRGKNLLSLVRQPELNALARGQIEGDLVEFTSVFDDARRLEARRVPIHETRALILIRDVTELNRLLSMRQEFIANVSHELRSPLTVIVGYVETLLTEDFDREMVRELIEKLRSPTTRMRALVDDLLLLTRLEASPNPSEEELCLLDMRALINSVVNDGRALSAGRHQIDVEVTSNAQLIGIESELMSACLNLLTNAVRYSPDGGEIRVSWSDVENGCRFAVEDHGMGIPPEHLSRITERFYRVDLAKSRVRGGTGLGLAIVKHVLKRHGSELQITSELAKGSTFYCDFPASRLSSNEQNLTEEAK